MKFAVYQGAIVNVEKEHETFITITTDEGSLMVDKEKLLLIQDGVLDEVKSELDTIKIQIAEIMNRIYRLDQEYHKKMEALREMYLEARSKEMKVVNQIIRNSQKSCQK